MAQGWEAGGRVRGHVATLPLVPAVVDAVKPVPVIAAGGIADGRGLAGVLALGAQAGWLGTRLLLAEEASVDAEWRRRVVRRARRSVDTTVFDGGWPDAPHRMLRNSTLDAREHAGRPAAPRTAGQGRRARADPRRQRRAPLRRHAPTCGATGAVEALTLYAGQSAAMVNAVRSAAAIIDQLASDAAATLEALAPATPPRRRVAAWSRSRRISSPST